MGVFRKVHQLYLSGRRKPSVAGVDVRFTHGGYSDYDGESLVAAYFSDSKLRVVDMFYRRQVEEAKLPEDVQENVAGEFYPGIERIDTFYSLFADSDEAPLIIPPEEMRFEPGSSSKIGLTAYNCSRFYNQTKRIGEVFNPDWIKPFVVVTSTIGERLRLQRMQRRGIFWDVSAPLVIDNQPVTVTALSQGLEWRNINKVFPVTFNMIEPTKELPDTQRKSLPVNN